MQRRGPVREEGILGGGSLTHRDDWRGGVAFIKRGEESEVEEIEKLMKRGDGRGGMTL